MSRRQSLLFTFIALTTITTLSATLHAADPVEGRVTNVTLYRGQAQVTRAVPVDGEPGSLEIVVGNLPEQVVPNSLFAEGGDAVEIRAVRFRTRAVGEEPREEVRALDRQILEAQRQIDLTAKRQALLGKRTEYLAKLEGFVAPTAQADLAKGVLDAEALERLTTFAFAQHEKIAEEEVDARQAGARPQRAARAAQPQAGRDHRRRVAHRARSRAVPAEAAARCRPKCA